MNLYLISIMLNFSKVIRLSKKVLYLILLYYYLQVIDYNLISLLSPFKRLFKR